MSSALSSSSNRALYFPAQIKYIVGNEACERFSFYGMRSILVVFMTHSLLLPEHEAKGIFHLFISANYFLTLMGAYLADRFLGRYKTILYLSLVYCLGHFVLALFESRTGLYWGLALISLGAGGIKPCVSAYVGDQFDQKSSHLLNKVYDIFYFSINFGSFFSTLLIPEILPRYGSRVAFGIPGLLMAIATYLFWLGRKKYVTFKPASESGDAGFFVVVWYMLTHAKDRPAGGTLWDVALQRYSKDEVDAVKAALSVFKVFITVAMFWALWDQQGSSWVLQAERMNRTIFGFTIEASQLQALNPIFVLILIPAFSLGLYPWIERMGIKVTPLRKIGAGMALAGFSFGAMALLQILIDQGSTPSVLWQIIPYAILTASEIMVSITGLEFAYTQAPRMMKSTIMSFWYLAIAGGNFLTALVSEWNRFHGSMEFFFFASLMWAVTLIFVIAAMKYRVRDFISVPSAAELAPA